MTRNRDGKKPPASHNYVKLLELHTSKIASGFSNLNYGRDVKLSRVAGHLL